MLRIISDVVIVGAGSAGAHAAALMARGGLDVTLIDRRARGDAGARWLNDVPFWMFDAAGVRAPSATSHRDERPDPFRICSPDGEILLRLQRSPLAEVDMRSLCLELADEVELAASGQVLWETELKDVEINRRGRPIAATCSRRGEALRLEAELFVDASGLAAALRRRVPALASACPAPEREDLCVAAQEVRQLADPHGAESYLEQYDSAPGEFISHLGVAGGYSVVRTRVAPDLKSISILTGSVAVDGIPSGRQLLDKFVHDNAWVGALSFGGARAIPLRRPYSHLVAPGIALIGDAACQVYSGHGSGVGIGLIAAKQLSVAACDAKRSGVDIGRLDALWGYAASFHRRWGGLLCFADFFRRYVQQLSTPEMRALFVSGLLTSGIIYDGLAQQRPGLHTDEIFGQLRAAWQNPELLGAILPVLVRLPLLEGAARLYFPEDPSPRGLDLYEVLIQTLLGS